MPKYIDHHVTMPMTPEQAKAVVTKMKSRQKDQFGVIGLNAFVSQKETWCLTDAPNAESVHKGHEAMGINLGTGDVTEVQSLI
ncbi:MAG: DUF4242 domain-containing protein [Chloroflexi bacterium]|nr:DUF4242 domain-containing protein [Chloroflexota bacterium]